MAILRLADCCVPEEDILRSYMPMLGLPSPDALRLFMRLESELDEEYEAPPGQGKAHIGTIKGLLDVEPETRRRVIQGIIDLNLNINQQRYFMKYIMNY